MTPRIVVCGLGPGGANQLTEATTDSFDRIENRFLRTAAHPTAERVGTDQSFDHLYEAADSFAEIYAQIATSLLEQAGSHGEILYAVPGSPLVLEQSVRNLRNAAPAHGVDLELLPAISFLDEVWARLQIDPVEEQVTLIDGYQFATAAAGQPGPLLVAHTHANWVLSDIKLAGDLDDSHTAIILQRLGTDQENIQEVAWSDLDRVVEADHLTSLYIPKLNDPVGRELLNSVHLMERLRNDCPWDAKQTHGSLRKYLVEETYEVVDVLDRIAADEVDGRREGPIELDEHELYRELEEELGDLWFQVLFHSVLAQEQGYFNVADVARTLHDKMVERHPHVFGAEEPTSSQPSMPTVESWEKIKQREKQRTSAFDDIPGSLPALAKADKIIKRGTRAGLPFGEDVVEALLGGVSELGESATTQQVGQALLAVTAVAFRANVDPEIALRETLAAVIDRGREIELDGGSLSKRWIYDSG